MLILLAGVVLAAAQAEPGNRDFGVGFCALHRVSGTACPSCDRQEAGPAPPVDPRFLEAQRLADGIERHRKLLVVLQTYGIPLARTQAAAAAPADLVELGRRLDRLYVAAVVQQRYLQWEEKENLEAERNLPALMKEWAAEEARLKTEADGHAAQTATLAAEIRIRGVAAEAREKRARKWKNNAELMKEFAATSSSRVFDALHPLLPPEERKSLHESMRGKWGAKAFMPAVLPAPEEAPRGPPSGPTPLRPEVRDLVPWLKKEVRPPAGTVEDKVKAFDDVRSVLADVGPAVESQRKRLKPLLERTEAARVAVSAARAKAAEAEASLARTIAAGRELDRRILEALDLQNLSVANALKLAAASLVWEEVRDRVVMPRVEEFLEANGLLNGLKAVEALAKIREHPEQFIPKVGALKGMPQLIETAKKVAALEELFEGWALQAARALGEGKATVDPALVRNLFFSLEREEVELAKTASGSLGGALGKLAAILVEKAPRE